MGRQLNGALALFLLVATGLTPAEGQTIPEKLAAAQGKSLKMEILYDVRALPIEELVKGADLIVQGKFVRKNSYLSKDEKHLYTDYEVIPTEVFGQRDQRLSKRPTAPPETHYTVQLYGGELTIGGSTITVNNHSRARFASGTVMLLFLTPPDRETGKRSLYGDSAGAFEIVGDGRLKPLVPDEPDPWLKDAHLNTVIQRIRTLQAR